MTRITSTTAPNGVALTRPPATPLVTATTTVEGEGGVMIVEAWGRIERDIALVGVVEVGVGVGWFL